MQPFGDKASISEAKLTDYVLSPTHRIGGTKSAFVRSLWVIRTGDDVAKFVSAFVVTDRRAGSEDKNHD